MLGGVNPISEFVQTSGVPESFAYSIKYQCLITSFKVCKLGLDMNHRQSLQDKAFIEGFIEQVERFTPG